MVEIMQIKVIRKLREWLRRYLPAEIIGTVTAVAGAFIGFNATGSYVIGAIAGTIGENIGYYGYFVVRESLRHYKNHAHHSPLRRIGLVAFKTLRDMLVEFGPAEALDSFLVRPFFMYIMPQIIPNFAAGVLAGKLIADVVFYTFAIIGYEFKKRWILEKDNSVATDKSIKNDVVEQTPHLDINLAKVTHAYHEFKQAMPEVGIHYAMKCNPHTAILRHVAELGGAFEVASATELDQLVALGIHAQNVLYSNPVKPIEHIARAHTLGIWRFAFDSKLELRKIAQVAPGTAVYVRIAAPKHQSGVPSEGKFGIDAKSALELLRYAKALGLQPYGIAFHVGSQMEYPEVWEHAIKTSGDIMRRLRRYSIELKMLNIGGGFPSYYSRELPTIAMYGAHITAALQKHLPYKVEVVAEPGRYLVAEAGIFVATIIGVAKRFNKTWLHLDIGAFNGLMESLETQNTLRFPMTDSKQGRATAFYHITGPTCDSQDTLLYDALLSKNLTVGDKIYIHSAGAYTTSYASTFNGFSIPTVHVVG